MRRFYCRNNVSKCDMWVIIHLNIRGYDSKALSLHAIANIADVVTINETYLKNNRILNMHTLKVFEGKDDDEVVITRHGQ